MDRALAAAAYMTTPKVRPTTNYPLELHYIRALFIQQNYRQCIHACRDVLRVAKGDTGYGPLQRTFVLFYLALAYDELARVMHPNSQTKLPALNSAEYYFLEAVQALPSIEQVRVHYAHSFQRDADVLSGSGRAMKSLSTTDIPGVRQWKGDSDPKSFRALSSVHATSQHSLVAESMASHEVTDVDFDDVHSDSSFDEILSQSTTRHLQRDFSRISLLDGPQAPHLRPQPHGLMRPIRLGSPPKPYHPPQFRNCRLTLNTNLRPSIHTRRAYTDTGAIRPLRPLPTEQVSPVSPLDPSDHHSEASTISPVSPTTPPHTSTLPSPLPPSIPSSDDLLATRLNTHLCAIRIQLETHIAMVQQAKQQLFRTRANRLSSAPTPRTSLATTMTATSSSDSTARSSFSIKQRASSTPSGVAIQQVQHFWSRADEEERRAEKSRRLEEGRERKWVRSRFQAERYQDLAERALAEL